MKDEILEMLDDAKKEFKKDVDTEKETTDEAIKTEGKTDWGFDLTDIPAEKWQELVDMFKLKLTHVDGKAFDWVSPNLVIITSNNPITGDYYQKGRRDNEKGYAGYIGITGDKASVLKAKNFIKKNATEIKDESKNQRDFI